MTQFILAAQASGNGVDMSFIFMMVAIFAIMYFFMIRPQQKRQKEIQSFQNTLEEGTQVITGGGIYGTVKKIDLSTGITNNQENCCRVCTTSIIPLRTSCSVT
mgnify:CR=1 FL=1